jgi:DNA mismatch repair protein MutS2
MLRFFPESALVQLEFEKVRELLTAHCRTAWAKDRVAQLRIHTKKEYIDLELNQTNEYKQILQSGQYFPNDFITNIEREIKLLSIPGATLSGEQFILVRRLAENASNIFRWLDAERRSMYPALTTVVNETYYEKAIISCIDDVLDDLGNVRDNASPELMQIRQSLHRKRQELRRVFDKLVSRMNKQGYLADIEESFINGRRVLAVYAEQKRPAWGK